MSRLAILLMLISFIAACNDDIAGPDLGPTVGPEFMGLRIELLSPTVVEATRAVTFQVKLTNVDTEPFTMTDPQFDVYVLARNGELLWNWLHDKVIIGGADVIIEPGGTYVLDIDWNQELNEGGRISPGTYSIFGVFFFPQPPALVSQTRLIAIQD